MRGARLLMAIASVVYAGCGLAFVGLSASDDDNTPPPPGQSDGGPSADTSTTNVDDTGGSIDGSIDAPVATQDSGFACPASGRGPTMVLVNLSATSRFCIDSTEVTRGQYKAFLDTNPSSAAQPSSCSWNTTFTPDPGNPDMTATQLPMVKVDWCDALAFCAWSGKRLCGSVVNGGPLRAANPQSAAVDPKQSEWMAACTHDGTRSYPYGDPYVASKCNGDGSVLFAGGTYAQCVGGYPGIFDMNGNVTEWENICDNGQGNAARCFDRGGSAYGAEARCTYASLDKVVDRSSDWGIRCCATPK